MISDGFIMMLLGMGAVYLFLILMVIIINWAAKVLAPFAHIIEDTKQQAKPKAAKKTTADQPSKAVVEAIVEAVKLHRAAQDKN